MSNFHNRRSNRRQTEPTWPNKWHRIRAIREREQVSLSALAYRTKLKASVLQQMEDEGYDLPLSMLYRLAKGLGVPISELLLEPEGGLSEPIRQRACMVRIARTAHTMLEKSRDSTMRYLSETLVNQLTELMPELNELGTWPEVGKRRSPTDVPRIMERMVSHASAPIADQTNNWWDHVSHQDA